jgi:DNA repair protein RadC
MSEIKDISPSYFHAEQNKLIASALCCLENRIKYHSDIMSHPQDVNDYLRLQLGNEPNEVFAAIFLTNANRMIKFEKLFFGTINETRVYPRVVVQRAIVLNAASIIFAHNHPAGTMMPSTADKYITGKLKNILNVIDVRVLDHFIVSHESSYSFAEHGLL